MIQTDSTIFRLTTEQTARFWSRVAIAGPDDCWLWTGKLFPSGYGRISFFDVSIRAHRIAYGLSTGTISDDRRVCHRCDNPRCCNPAHLFLGTDADNQKDCSCKGRKPKGESHSQHRFSESQIRLIRARYAAGGVTSRSLGKEYGVTKKAIMDIVRRRTWRHVG